MVPAQLLEANPQLSFPVNPWQQKPVFFLQKKIITLGREQKQEDHLFDHALRSKAWEHLATETRDNVVKKQAINKYIAGEELQSCADGQSCCWAEAQEPWLTHHWSLGSPQPLQVVLQLVAELRKRTAACEGARRSNKACSDPTLVLQQSTRPASHCGCATGTRHLPLWFQAPGCYLSPALGLQIPWALPEGLQACHAPRRGVACC